MNRHQLWERLTWSFACPEAQSFSCRRILVCSQFIPRPAKIHNLYQSYPMIHTHVHTEVRSSGLSRLSRDVRVPIETRCRRMGLHLHCLRSGQWYLANITKHLRTWPMKAVQHKAPSCTPVALRLQISQACLCSYFPWRTAIKSRLRQANAASPPTMRGCTEQQKLSGMVFAPWRAGLRGLGRFRSEQPLRNMQKQSRALMLLDQSFALNGFVLSCSYSSIWKSGDSFLSQLRAL